MSETPAHIWFVLALLLGLSASFSASETALFSLTAEQQERAGSRVQRLIARPRQLLITVLFGNLVVNLLFFAFAARLELPGVQHGAILVGAGALIAVLVGGEILPKTIALRGALPLARAAAVPLSGLVAVTGPLRRAITAILDFALRVLGEAWREEPGITGEDLARVLEKSADEGLIDDREASLLSEILELGGTRVREIMTPRVDALVLDLAADSGPILRTALERHHNWLPVCDGGVDHVVGCVRLRDVLRRRDEPIARLVKPVKFVPEVARALDLLRQFRTDHTAEAVVVDEWGGTAGIVTIEDLFESLVGDLRVEGEARDRPVVPLGEGRFRVAGNLSIRDWNDEFGHSVVPTEFETLGGFVTAQLGRIPRTGDRVRAGELVCEVRDVRGRRVLSVDIHVEPPAEVAT
jgi:CBS domain containing-hemolysin-like protein